MSRRTPLDSMMAEFINLIDAQTQLYAGRRGVRAGRAYGAHDSLVSIGNTVRKKTGVVSASGKKCPHRAAFLRNLECTEPKEL